MPTSPSRRSPLRALARPDLSLLLAGVLMATSIAAAQTAASSPASVPAGADPPAPAAPVQPVIPVLPAISHKQIREAETFFLDGAKAVEHQAFGKADSDFARALQLNPGKRDYALALIVTREHRVSALVHDAARARLLGNTAHADDLIAQARAIDPDNPVIAQHVAAFTPLQSDLTPHPLNTSLAGAIELSPTADAKDVHLRGSTQEVLRALFQLYGIRASFDPSVTSAAPIRLDLDHVTFADAARVAYSLTHTFGVPLDARSALIASDTQENRDKLQPQLEETLYMPGLSSDEMTEMANLARNIFDLKSVTASTATDSIVLRGDEQTLKVLNTTYANMLGGGSDVLLELKLYEVDRTNTRNIGFQIPTSAGIFSISAEAAQLVAANQAVVNQAIASGLIKLTGNSLTDLLTEVGFLIASGTVNVSQYTNLLGIFGNGLSLTGLYLGSGANINLLLNSSDVRTLDVVQLRAGDRQASNFRAGTRYPIETGIYSSGLSNSLASSVAGLNVNGTSVSSLLQQYLGAASPSVPQIQFEDLGLTLKATPHILHGGAVELQLEMKIESLGATTLNTIPVLNSRQLTSTITVPPGQTAMLVSQISSSETRAVQGIPGLSDIPGFQGTTNHSTEKDTGELLITITPHIVRQSNLRISSRPLLLPPGNTNGPPIFNQPTPQAPPVRRPVPATPGISPEAPPTGSPPPSTTTLPSA